MNAGLGRAKQFVSRRCEADERGSGTIEFVAASVLLLLPLVYVLLAVFDVQRSSFAATQAAREAGRAFATAPTSEAGIAQARVAAALAFEDQGLGDAPDVRFIEAGSSCDAPAVEPRLTAGAAYTVCVIRKVPLPYADKGFLGNAVPSQVRVVGRYALSVDRFRESA
jgi:hypothetical protein